MIDIFGSNHLKSTYLGTTGITIKTDNAGSTFSMHASLNGWKEVCFWVQK